MANPIASCEDAILMEKIKSPGARYFFFIGVEYILHQPSAHDNGAVHYGQCLSAKKKTFSIHDCGQTEVVTAEPYDEVPDAHIFTFEYVEPPWRVICPAAWWSNG